MKRCPRCNQTYDDDQLNFCLNDGELLTKSSRPPSTMYADDAPPTLVANSPRITHPFGQPVAAPPVRWQPPQPPNQQYRPYSPMRFIRSTDQTIPTVAMVLGIVSLPLVCCYGGIWLGLPAAILGYIGMRNADTDIERYGGRGMAVAGLILGVVSFLSTIIFVMFAVLAR